ncbi:MAG: hypothetical protein ACK53L_25980, partial [Pirellulaceae bacterium]
AVVRDRFRQHFKGRAFIGNGGRLSWAQLSWARIVRLSWIETASPGLSALFGSPNQRLKVNASG